MRLRRDRSEMCRHVQAAIADGRYLLDPGMWRSHLGQCAECRAGAEGLVLLHRALAPARAALDARALPRRDGRSVLADILPRYEALRRRRARIGRTTFGLVLALVLGMGLVVSRDPEPTPEPLAYARRLHAEVFPREGPPRYALLREDAGRRAEFLAALDHENQVVRRAALSALLLSGVELPPERVLPFLEEWPRELGYPVEIAATGEGGRYLAEALGRQRDATVAAALQGAAVQASRGGARVPTRAVLPLVTAGSSEIRKHALWVLSLDEGYRPGPELDRVLEGDPDPDVRAAAADCLLERTGEAGRARLLARWAQVPDPALEVLILSRLGTGADVLSLARRRLDDPATPVRCALAWALAIVRSGDRSPPERWVERALASADPDDHQALAALAAVAGWDRYRGALQERFRAAAPGALRTSLGLALTEWDLRVGDEARLELAVEICEIAATSVFRTTLSRLAVRPYSGIRARAEALLSRLASE